MKKNNKNKLHVHVIFPEKIQAGKWMGISIQQHNRTIESLLHFLPNNTHVLRYVIVMAWVATGS